jgi:hypothetical protein
MNRVARPASASRAAADLAAIRYLEQAVLELIRKRKTPIVGGGTGI